MIKNLRKTLTESDKKHYRQVKIIQGVGEKRIEFVADIPDDADETEKLVEAFEKLFKQMQKINFYNKNR